MTSPSETSASAARSGTFLLGGDLPVHRLGFGAMRLTGKGIWGEPRDRREAIAVLRRAVELGVNLIDTADSYGPEVSERLIAEALYPHRPAARGCARPLRARAAGLPAVVSARCRGGAARRGAPRQGRGPAARDARAGGDRVVAATLARDAPDPRDVEREAPGRERSRGTARAVAARLRGNRARVLTGIYPVTAVATSTACPALRHG